MAIDVTRYIGAVTRTVKGLEYNGKPARAVIATRTYDTTIDDVWDALTSAERLPRWFLPISGDLRLGGRYQLKGNAGGEITRCEPPRHLAVTWEFAGGVSWVNLALTEEGAAVTRLQLEHIAHIEGDFWDKFGPGAVGVGWDGALMGLARHLATGATLDAAEHEAWTLTDEGKQFSRLSSDDWCRASIVYGTDEAAAKAAAERTRAFYTGEGVAS